MASLQALVIEGGSIKRVEAADTLLVGSGISVGAGNLTITPGSGGLVDVASGLKTAGVLNVAVNGTVGAPAIILGATSDPNTGIYKPAVDQIGFSTGGNARLIIKNGSTQTETLNPEANVSFDLGTSTLGYRTLFVANLAAANGEGDIIELRSHLVPDVTATLDLGTSALRLRDVYVGGVDASGDLHVGGSVVVGAGPGAVITPAGLGSFDSVVADTLSAGPITAASVTVATGTVAADTLDATTTGVRFPDDTLQTTAAESFSGAEVTAPLTGDGLSGTPLALPKADEVTDGYLSSADFAAFDAKEHALIIQDPLVRTVDGLTGEHFLGAPTVVTGPASSSDNAIARFHSTSGKVIQSSGATISDAGLLTANSGIFGPLTAVGLLHASAGLDVLGEGGSADTVKIAKNGAQSGWLINVTSDTSGAQTLAGIGPTGGLYGSSLVVDDATGGSGRISCLDLFAADGDFNGHVVVHGTFNGDLAGRFWKGLRVDSGTVDGLTVYGGGGGDAFRVEDDKGNARLTVNTIGNGLVSVGAPLEAYSGVSVGNFEAQGDCYFDGDEFYIGPGNVGIGTPPVTTLRLAVGGSVAFGNADFTSGIITVNGSDSTAAPLSGAWGGASQVNIRNESRTDGATAGIGLLVKRAATDHSQIASIVAESQSENTYGPDILFTVRNGSSSHNELMRLVAQGRLGIGTSDPGTPLAVAGLTGTTSFNYLRYDTATGNFYFYTSSADVKENIRDLEPDPSVLDLRPRRFDLKPEAGGEKDHVGLVMEEVAEVMPEALARNSLGEATGVDFDIVTTRLLQVVQRQEARIRALEQRLKAA